MASVNRGTEENGTASHQRPEQLAWDPFRLLREMLGSWTAGFGPGFEMTEGDEGYQLRADLPGVKEEDLEISLTGNRLTISGHREQESSSGRFTRTFTLPAELDLERISAEMENGVLNLTIPKRPEHQPRRIAIGKRPGHKGKT
jgi:HSP20 family protein